MAEQYVVADLGATNGRVAVTDSLDQPVFSDRTEFPVTRSYAADLDALVGAIEAVTTGPATGYAISVAGTFDPDRESLVGSGHLADWLGKPLAADLATRLGRPTVLANDAEAAALGEAIFGELDQDYWYVSWGTGIGGCLVTFEQGRPVVTPAEIGHHVIDQDDTLPPDGCGASGCWESFVGGEGVTRRYGHPPQELTEESWDQVVGHMAVGLANLAMVRPTGSIVLAGGVTHHHADHLDRVEGRYAERLKIVPPPALRRATFGPDAGLVGALALLAQPK